MLPGLRVAYPQPRARTCCCHVGPAGPRPAPGVAPRPEAAAPGAAPGIGPRAAGMGVKAFGPYGGPAGGSAPRPAPRPGRKPPNCITTGTGPLALAGVVSVSAILTSISGSMELSTTPD